MTAYVKAADGTNTGSGSTASAAFSGNVTAGNIILICGSTINNDGVADFVLGDCVVTTGTSVVSDLRMSTQANALDVGAGGYMATQMWSGVVTTTGTLTVEVTEPGNAGSSVVISALCAEYSPTSGYEWPQTASRHFGDNSSGNAANNDTAMETGDVTSLPRGIFFGGVNTVTGAGTTITAGADFTERAANAVSDGGGTVDSQIQDRIVTSTTTDEANWTQGAGSFGWTSVLLGVEETEEPKEIPVPVGSLAFSEKTPTVSIANVREPDTDTLALDGKTPTVQHNRVSDVPLGALAFSEKTPTVSIGYTREPDTDALSLSGIVPTVVVANVREPDTDALAISGSVPTVNVTVEPDKDTLSLAGIIPTTVIANLREPDTDALALTGIAPTAGEIKTAVPDVVGLSLSGIAPTVVVANVTESGTDGLALSGQAPTTGIGETREPSTDGLSLTGETPTVSVANVTAPSVGSLSISGKTPEIPSDGTIEVPTGGINIWKYVGLKLDGYPPQVSFNYIPIPDTDALAFTGITPTITETTAIEPALGTLAISGQTPTIEERFPGVGSLSITGDAPTVVVANNIIVPLGTLALSGKTPEIPTGDNIEVPTGGINIWQYIGLKLDGYPPTLSFNYALTPSTDGLTLSGYAPDLNVTVEPGTASLSLSGQAVTLQGTVSVSTGALTLKGFATIDQDTVTVPTGALALSGQGITLKGIEEPTTGTLTFASDVLTIDIDLTIEPSTGSLALSGQGITSFLPKTIEPSTVALAFASDVPQVGVGAAIPEKGALSLSGIAPTVQVKSYADPDSDSLAFSGKTPTVDVAAAPPISIEVGTASLELFSTTLGVESTTATLTLAGQPLSIFYRDGTFIENANATTSVPSNYEQCDFSGFRQLPGSLKLTWNKHSVRKKSWEERHPQDTLQSVPERQKGSRRPEQTDKFIDTLYPNGVDPDDL